MSDHWKVTLHRDTVYVSACHGGGKLSDKWMEEFDGVATRKFSTREEALPAAAEKAKSDFQQIIKTLEGYGL